MSVGVRKSTRCGRNTCPPVTCPSNDSIHSAWLQFKWACCWPGARIRSAETTCTQTSCNTPADVDHAILLHSSHTLQPNSTATSSFCLYLVNWGISSCLCFSFWWKIWTNTYILTLHLQEVFEWVLLIYELKKHTNCSIVPWMRHEVQRLFWTCIRSLVRVPWF
jgi:hypothetical protein